MIRLFRWIALACLTSVAFPIAAQPPAERPFKVGFAKREITPEKPMPMWGYGDRHAMLSTGVLDPLFAKVIVIDTGKDKLALMGMDMGRSPTAAMMDEIRKAVKESRGVNYIMISGSHSHHGPVIELTDEDGKGKGKFDDAVAYSKALPKKLIEAINEAAANVKDAKIGWGSKMTTFNRNRHTKIEPKPRDPELAIVRFDDNDGKPIAILVNFAAHATILPSQLRKYSAEWPGQMNNTVEKALGTNCFFMQGAAGDLSPNRNPQMDTIEQFGAAVGSDVVEIAKGIQTKKPEKPSVAGMDEDFSYTPRVNLGDKGIQTRYSMAFFPDLVGNFVNDLGDGKLHPHLTTVLLNGDLALVGASGEFFSNHSVRLKERSRAGKTLFFGYCNGHHMYFPTIEAASEGGYGAGPEVSWVAIGGPEQMMNKALINIYTLMGKFPMF